MLMNDIRSFKKSMGGICENMKNDMKVYHDGLATIFKKPENILTQQQ